MLKLTEKGFLPMDSSGQHSLDSLVTRLRLALKVTLVAKEAELWPPAKQCSKLQFAAAGTAVIIAKATIV